MTKKTIGIIGEKIISIVALLMLGHALYTGGYQKGYNKGVTDTIHNIAIKCIGE